MRKNLVICLSLVVIVLALFAPSHDFELISYDDPAYALDPHLQQGITADSIAWCFRANVAANWHPITLLSLALDYNIHGQAASAFHRTNIALHVCNTALVFLLLSSMTRTTWPAALVALLFAVHPLRVGSVAWVSERKGLLAALFSLLSLLGYVQFARTEKRVGRIVNYAIAVLAAALAMMSKPTSVVLPFVLILVDVWPLDRVGNTRWLPLLAEKIPFFLLSIADSVATYVFQTEGGGVAAVNPSLGLRLANAVDAYARYLWLTVFPRGLTMFYPYRGVVVGTKLPAGEVAAAFVVLIAMTGVAIALWRRTRAPLVGWLWFLGCLVPMIGIVQVGEQSMADRYTYFPHIGLWAGLVFGFAAFAPQKSPWARGLGIICVVAAVIFAARSSIELGYWKNERTLYTHAVAISDHNPVAHACLGYSYSKDPETATDAEREYHIALDIDPKDAFTHMNLANLLQEQGRLPEAISHYQYTVEVAPRGFIFHYNYGLGLARNNRERDALRELEKAVELAPDHSGARYALGLALINTGQRERALPHLHRARDLATAQKQEALLKQINDLLGGK